MFNLYTLFNSRASSTLNSSFPLLSKSLKAVKGRFKLDQNDKLLNSSQLNLWIKMISGGN